MLFHTELPVALVDDVIVDWKTRFESQLARMNCQVFSTGMPQSAWHYTAHRFYEAVLEGKGTDAFRLDLLL
jgi:hypothetical protein